MSHVLIPFKIAIKTIVVLFAKIYAIPAVILLGTAGYNTTSLTNQTPPIQIIRQVAPDNSFDASHLEARLKDLENTNLGGTNSLPTSVAIFSTSLQSAITSTQTTMTLNSATYNNGASTIASSTYDFIIDEGTTVQEFVSADCTGVACTNMTRGLSWLNGTTTVSTLQFAHRRGASVKITDAPIVLKLNWLALGGMGYPSPIKYTSIATTTIAADRNNIASVGLVQDISFSGAGIIDATTAAKGVVEIATQTEVASSTSTGGSGTLAIPASAATSTFNLATAALRVVVTQNNGKFDNNFISTSTLGPGLNTYKTIQTSTTTGLSAWSPPAGVSTVCIQAVGAGGGGGAGIANHAGNGGGAGGYAEGCFSVLATSTIVFFVPSGGVGGAAGAANPGSAGGTTTVSSFITAGGGAGGGTQEGVSPGGGVGGMSSTTVNGISNRSDLANSTGASINIQGGDGGTSAAVSASFEAGGQGGASFFGGGGRGDFNASGPVPTSGKAYGSGGGGGSNNTSSGGNGAPGYIIFRY